MEVVKSLDMKLDGVKEEDTEDETVEGDSESFGERFSRENKIVKCCTLRSWFDLQTIIIIIESD